MLALFFLILSFHSVNIAAIADSSLVSAPLLSHCLVYFVDLVRDALLIRDIIPAC